MTLFLVFGFVATKTILTSFHVKAISPHRSLSEPDKASFSDSYCSQYCEMHYFCFICHIVSFFAMFCIVLFCQVLVCSSSMVDPNIVAQEMQ